MTLCAYQRWTGDNPLRLYRLRKKISFRAAAREMRVTVSTISLWETGTNQPTYGSMQRIAEFMNTSEQRLRRLWTEWLDRRPAEAA